ncbi:MAG: hypothetical protein ACR2G3_04085, partial [Solirubrobacterales bacterium]
RRPSALRRALKVLAVLGVLAGIGVAAVIGARQVYFLGGDEGGRVALFRGLPYDLPLGIELYGEVEASPIQVSSLSERDQETVAAHELRSEDDANSLIDSLESRVEPRPDPKPKPGGAEEKPAQDGGSGGGQDQKAGAGGN